MKIVKRKVLDSNSIDYSYVNKLHIETIDDNSIKITYWKRYLPFSDFIPIDTPIEYRENPNFEIVVNINDLFFDFKSKDYAFDSHALIVMDGELLKEKTKCVNIFKYTKETKGTIGSVRSLLGISPICFFIIPFVDSKLKDCTIVVPAETLVVNGTEITEDFNLDEGTHFVKLISKFYPNILLTKDNNTITAQLDIPKENVEIYFETTTGYLNKTRALTDATGKATVKVFGDELEGKVKAGFKHFSGKAEINI